MPQHPKASLLRKLRWPLRIVTVFAGAMALLVLLIFNPNWLYAHATEVHGWTVYHDAPLPPELADRIAEAQTLIAASELDDPSWKLELCLDDGSAYPGLQQRLQGEAFGWGYLNKIVLGAPLQAASNCTEIRGMGFNLRALIAHEAIHCLQYHDLGFWQSRPVADIPLWKWEGYAEYIARKSPQQPSLQAQIQSTLATMAGPHDGWIYFPDGNGAPLHYAQFHILVRYCMDIEGMTWRQIIADPRDDHAIVAAISHWMETQN